MSIAALLTLLKTKTVDPSYYYKSIEDGKEEHSSSIFRKIHLTVEKYHLSRRHTKVSQCPFEPLEYILQNRQAFVRDIQVKS